MAHRSDRDWRNPRGSTSFELVRMVGSPGTQDRPRWSVRSGEQFADLIKASGHARRTQRPHGWLQPRPPCHLPKKALAVPEASMDGPPERTVKGQRLRLR
jgi:hypothetical protein